MDKHEIKPMMIYRMADKEQKGVVQANDLVSSFQRLLPSADQETTKAFARLFPGAGAQVDKDSYAKMFSTSTDEPLGDTDDSIDSNGLTVGQVYWLRKFYQAIVDVDMTLESFWHVADEYSENLISQRGLTIAITQNIPELSSMDIINITAAFETDDLYFDIFAKKLNAAQVSTHSAQALSEFEKGRMLVASPQKSPSKSKIRQSDPPKQVEPATQLGKDMDTRPQTNESIRAMAPAGSLPFSFYDNGFFNAQDIASLLENFTAQTFGPQTIFNKNFFQMHFTRAPFSLQPQLAQALFASLDCYGKSSIYTYNLLSVLDSFRDPAGFAQFPVAHNQQVPVDRRHMWRDLAASQTKSLNRLMGNRLGQKLTDADWLGPLTKILNIRCDVNQLKFGLPNNACWYHVAVVLQSYLDTVELNTEQIMTQVFSIGGLRDMASNFFGGHGIQADTLVDHSNLYSVIGAPLQLTESEAAQLYSDIYTNAKSQKPIFFFFTYYDMILSMFNGDRMDGKLPRMPMPYRTNLPENMKELFKKLSQKPPIESIDLSAQFTEMDLI